MKKMLLMDCQNKLGMTSVKGEYEIESLIKYLVARDIKEENE